MTRVSSPRRIAAASLVPVLFLMLGACSGGGGSAAEPADPPTVPTGNSPPTSDPAPTPPPAAPTTPTTPTSPLPVPAPLPTLTLDPLRAPSQNFDLSHWKLTLPSGSEVKTVELNSGYQYADVFYTDPLSGGMVFRCPNIAGTTANSNYSRSELRELLNPSNSDSKHDSNNWRPEDGGTLTATLRVDRVSTTGEDRKVGRIIIGQIHGPDTEPARLYYHKRPGEARGRIYLASESMEGSTWWSPDIVGNSGNDGIALGERFAYEITLRGQRLVVNILRDGGARIDTLVRDIDADYLGENQYFKAGVYNQNNTGDVSDYAQATFFALEQRHP